MTLVFVVVERSPQPLHRRSQIRCGYPLLTDSGSALVDRVKARGLQPRRCPDWRPSTTWYFLRAPHIRHHKITAALAEQATRTSLTVNDSTLRVLDIPPMVRLPPDVRHLLAEEDGRLSEVVCAHVDVPQVTLPKGMSSAPATQLARKAFTCSAHESC